MSLFDRLLDFGCVFDWINPIVAEVQDIINGPNHTFMIPIGCGWSGGEIARLLKSYGVETWGHMIVNGEIMLTCRKPQAKWAEYIILHERIPIDYGLAED